MGALRHIALVFLLIVGSLGVATAQEIIFTTSVDRSTIAAGEQLTLTLTIANIQGNISPPTLNGFVVLRGPTSRADIIILGGMRVSRTTYTWILTAVSPGRFTIGKCSAKVGNAVIETDPITIEVSAPLTRPSSPQLADGQRRNPDIFITLELSRSKGYVGEQVVLSYMLYSRTRNVEPQWEMPKLEGFWSEDVNLATSGWLDRYETVNGLRYHVAIIKRQLLFPQRSGKLRIAPYSAKFILDRDFFSRGRVAEVSSNAIEYMVSELPPGAPADFNGAVGDLQMSVKADRTSLKADEALELTVRFSGRSNLKLLEGPRIDLPNDFEVYDPKVTDKISVSETGMSGQREFQYLVIPRYEGRYELDPITFSYFDTKTGTYRTLSSDPFTFDVAVGAGGPTPAAQRPGKSDVKLLGTDIRYIRTDTGNLRPKGELLFGSTKWWAGMATPALAFALLLVWHRRQQREQADVVGMRRKRADKVARERLKQAAAALKQNERVPFYTALSKAMHGYLADKFGLGVAEISEARLKDRLAEKPNGEALAKELATLIATCDMARFAPVEDRPRQDLYDQAADLIGRTEQITRA